MSTDSRGSTEPEYRDPSAINAQAEISSRIAAWESTTVAATDPWAKLVSLFTADLFRQRLANQADVRQILTGTGTVPARLSRAQCATKQLLRNARRATRLLSIQLARDVAPKSKS